MGEIEGGDRFCVSGQLPVWFTLKSRDEATEEERRERARWANLHLPLRNLNAPLKKIPLRYSRFNDFFFFFLWFTHYVYILAKIETFDLSLCKVSTFSYFRIRVLMCNSSWIGKKTYITTECLTEETEKSVCYLLMNPLRLCVQVLYCNLSYV